MAFPRLFPLSEKSATFASVATNASSRLPIMVAATSGQVVRAVYQHATATGFASGTTTGSSGSVVLYKNASNSASVIATFNGSGTNVATLASATLLTSGTTGTVNSRFVAGDLILAEYLGGVAQTGSTLGAFVQVDFVYGHEGAAAPTAGTGPA